MPESEREKRTSFHHEAEEEAKDAEPEHEENEPSESEPSPDA